MTHPADEFDTSAAREAIFKRTRALQGRPDTRKPHEAQLAREYMEQHRRGPQPSPVDDVVALFVEKSKAMLCSVDRVATLEEAVNSCRDYLAHQGLVAQGEAVIWPSLKHLDWSALGMPVRWGAPTGDDRVGISGTAFAVAETGTLVLASSPETPTSTHLLPETHIALVHEHQIAHTLEDVFARMRAQGMAMPRALNCVSGPSRTADIEQTIVLGAHGPYRVHLVIIKEA
ncbi:MAG TPA: lactate utilization protein [Limnobacter sp.]|uniref:LutC/YkgG family protein n=1 Tax=Limnobacter sp. TaxID=2003368 RepID=UPI002EDB056F